jgi:pimeloyl-ACP methyl ester carboxylesterase
MTAPRKPSAEPLAITRRGIGNRHFLLVPGLVPDGPETYWRQMRLLRAFGWTTTITYPYETFSLDVTVEWIRRWIRDTRAAGRDPVLVGCSVGGGICLEALRRDRAAGTVTPIAGLVLVSPFTCVEDLASLLRRLLQPILAEIDKTDGRPELALERGRTFFKSLASRALAEGKAKDEERARSPFLTLFSYLTPQGLMAMREAKVRARIEHTLDAISTVGGTARVAELRKFPGIESGANSDKPITQAPTLIMWGSKERQTLTMEGPGTGVLCRPDLAYKWLPNLEVHWVYDQDGGEVPHASLIKHARAFNQHLRRFLKRTAKATVAQRTVAATIAILP